MDHNRTRLWLASPGFYPTYGGAQNRYRNYIPGLVERGLDVRVMAGTPPLHERSESEIDAAWYDEIPGAWLPSATINDAPIERIRLPDVEGNVRNDIYYKGLMDICRRPSNDPVVLQLLTNVKPTAIPWLRRFKSTGAAISCSISQYPKWPGKRIKRIFRKAGYRRMYDEFDVLVTNSEVIRDFLHDLGVTSRIEYIPNGVDLRRYSSAISDADKNAAIELRKRLKIPREHKVITTIGAVIPRKGQDKLIKAWCQLQASFPDVHLLIVGPRSDIMDSRLHDFSSNITGMIESSNAAHKVHFTGLVDDVESWLRASDIFVLASNREGTPNSVLEAMASKLPCIVTPFKGSSSAIGEAGVHYQLAERNARGIAGALCSLLESEDLCIEQGRRGRDFVMEHANLTSSLDRYAHLYNELGEISHSRRTAGAMVWGGEKKLTDFDSTPTT